MFAGAVEFVVALVVVPVVVFFVADVFQAEVQKISVPDSAALGAAMRAANAVAGTSWKELSAKFAKTTEKILPDTKTAELYKSMLAKYAELERRRGG